ncbi:protein canopy homolog 2-like [Scyliorhinus torazame]|uniref:protein canopy homolog 2-like n=1 Tax=Scyliorhinus torazame TaxID=75743 RepID=UPI003B5CC100
MTEYGELVDRDTHRSTYVRVLTRSGAPARLPDTLVTGDITSNLKRACEKLAEEYEDEFIEYLSRDSDNVKNELCSRRTDLCDHALHTPHHDEL